jgi:integrase
MIRAAERLSARAVQSAKKPGMYADGKGLYLRVGPSGSKSWVYRYRGTDGRHDLGLGPYPDFSLAEARERATAPRKLRYDGNDPLTLKRTLRASARLSAAAKAMTFAACAEQYIKAHAAGWRGGKSEQQWRHSFRDFVFPLFGDLPVQSIDVALVMKAIEPIWTAKPETANRVRGRIEAVLDWATAREFRTGDNPARWKGRIKNLLPAPRKVAKTQHRAALPYSEIGAFMVELRRQDKVAARALEFAILTAARTGEVLGARWDEIDLEAAVWTVPGSRMKEGHEHRVPLSEAALAVAAAMPRRSDFVFPARTGQALHDTMMNKILSSMGRRDVTVHGFRSTFRDWAAERTTFPAEVAEMALAHTVADKVEAAYRRGDLFAKRRQLAAAWGQYATSPPMPAGAVVPIRGQRA